MSGETADKRLRQHLQNRDRNQLSSALAADSLDPATDAYGFRGPSEFNRNAVAAAVSDYVGVLARRARKWEMFMRQRNSLNGSNRKLKRYIRKGIPSGLRSEVWLAVSGASTLKSATPFAYSELKDDGALTERVKESIRVDLPRTYPNNAYFNVDNPNCLLPALRRVLVALARQLPDIGYCQGFNFIAGLLLIVMKDEEDVFWLMNTLLSRILPKPSYYADGLAGLKCECHVLEELTRKKLPRLHDHLLSIGCTSALIATKWFLLVFIDVLPVETSLRVLDCVFFEGSKVLMRVALTLLRRYEDRLLACEDLGDVLTVFKDNLKVDPWLWDCHQFMKVIFSVTNPLSRETIAAHRNQFIDSQHVTNVSQRQPG